MAKILIGITGSISAYKMADVVSELKKRGHEAQCILTRSAREFVSPLALETLSGRPVKWELFGEDVSGTEHIDLARWPDLIVIAPASANTLAKLALGLADDLLSTVVLASRSPILIAPAMNTVMWDNPAIQQHVETLRQRGVTFIAPAEGVLACGEVGVGKLAPVGAILAGIEAASTPAKMDLSGRRILITAGPTTTPIDAVRYITNHSTGRMGAAMAEEALRRGAVVDYVLGIDKGVVRPVPPAGSAARLNVVEVRTAEEMAGAALSLLPGVEGVIATAAVMDYRVAQPEASKLKRSAENVTLHLVPSADVLQTLRNAAGQQWFLGFAAETDAVEENGRRKLVAKGLDYLFANRVAKSGETSNTGFGVATNGGVLLFANGERRELSVTGKTELARQIWDTLA